MHPAVVTAVLLLVGTTIAVADQEGDEGIEDLCHNVNPVLCKECHWVAFGRDSVCMRYFETPKTFREAQAHCHSLHSDLVSIHNDQDMLNVKYMSYYFTSGFERRAFWIGGKRSGAGFIYTDGTKFNYNKWLPNQPDNYRGNEACVESNALKWGMWNDAPCSLKKDFVCAKRK
ncbi:C-type isolectin Sp-CL4-like [Lycodopsis pacificus]